MSMITTTPGMSHPLGATFTKNGVNFCVFSASAEAVELLFFDGPDDEEPTKIIKLDPKVNKTFYYWHINVQGIEEGQIYGFRVYGPMNPIKGLRFDGSKLLLDPYSKGVAIGKGYSKKAGEEPGSNIKEAMKSVVLDSSSFDWEGDKPLSRPFSKTIIYELHVAGFTKHPSSGVADDKKGTYLGLIEKIPYLKELGVTAVELLPVQQFDHQDAPSGVNYWGYSPISFFAPHHAYGTTDDPIQTVNEFKEMVKAFHKAGIEVILDVVYNHTSEGGDTGPIQCFKGFENSAYYSLNAETGEYKDFSGCGNSLDASHSIVRRLIMDSLCYWVKEMHVDGFRFDLASVLSRDEYGNPMKNPPILWEIESEPVLAGTKIIAEAWDAAGLYQVGNFIGDKWAEWNGMFRDDAREFMKGDTDTVWGFGQRLIGSPDMFSVRDRDPNRSINFITCHDGFTLNDLVSYNEKHNLANGEHNRDGEKNNASWNCGVEGPTPNKEIEALRLKQIKNFFTILFLAQGTPMILMGDEFRRTQKGNNNAYCQDNELSWVDWEMLDDNKDVYGFVKSLIKFNISHSIFQEDRFWVDLHEKKSPHIQWHGVKCGKPDWGKNSHSIALTLHKKKKDPIIHVMFNAYWEDLYFELPVMHDKPKWRRVIDTSLPSPEDYCEYEKGIEINKAVYKVQSRSIVVVMIK
ncbi:glycogen debranching protein GlgX [Flammeovirgaceae bacterium SG7u.111]|nr:glycogen debranching protein GlgX [Flammeovirgaceae bacterium SG7u.132]WPO35271.1 glycogen debranching protein GlgX [Flammeovirgaceae bacterium SG7u.111]